MKIYENNLDMEGGNGRTSEKTEKTDGLVNNSRERKHEDENEPDNKSRYGSDSSSSSWLKKEELLRYAEDPFWKNIRLFLFIVSWKGWLAMLVSTIIITILAPRCSSRPIVTWYKKNSVYQVYPKSFKDSTARDIKNKDSGAGVGDIKGIQSKLRYFEDIGVKTLYISSLYKSGGQDNGMDVVNHKDIDPIFGTMQDFDEFHKETKKKNIRLIMDFIPNHTSRNHSWFDKSRKKVDPYTDFYIWVPCTSSAMPNNWLSIYGGSAWEYDSARGECYYHHYLKEEPDINLRNPKVKKEMEEILRFWFEKGVDGFNIIGADALFESGDIAKNEPPVNLFLTDMEYDYLNHTFTRHLPESIELISYWTSISDEFATEPGKERMIIVNVTGNINETKAYYGSEETKGANFVMTSPVDFSQTLSAGNVAARVKEYTAADMPKWAWSFGDQDNPRLASRVGTKTVKGMLALQMLLPGVPVNYYGNELGMRDGNVTFDKREDILAKDYSQMDYGRRRSRDPYRTPMQWTNDKYAGFSANEPWLTVNANYTNVNVEAAHNFLSQSPLNAFKQLTKLRENESFQWGATTVGTVGEILWFKRHAEGFPGFVVVINLGTESQILKINEMASVPFKLELVFHSHNCHTNKQILNFEGKGIYVDSYEVLVFKYL